MREGANLHEQNQIRRMTEEGKTVAQISRELKIYEENVQGWVDHFFPEGNDSPEPEEATEETEDD